MVFVPFQFFFISVMIQDRRKESRSQGYVGETTAFGERPVIGVSSDRLPIIGQVAYYRPITGSGTVDRGGAQFVTVHIFPKWCA